MDVYRLLRPLLFALDAERCHELTFGALAHLPPALLPKVESRPEDALRCMGLTFPNPVGLAAGLDKNGEAIDALGALGFGFLEIGTVTPRPQPGNPAPRLFRIPEARAVINRMGFNNKGVDHLVQRVRESSWRGILGINIGKNFDTPIEQAAEDYRIGLAKVYPHASYVTVNISSPNTSGLRSLQGGGHLGRLLGVLREERQSLQDDYGRRVPIVVKIAPDLDADEIRAIADLLVAQDMDGVIATNTTLSRDGVAGLRHADETGGLSGAPLGPTAATVTSLLVEALGGAIPVIASGGVMSGEDAAGRKRRGAQLIQLCTGLIYRGPELIGEALAAWRTASGRAC